VAAIIFDFDGTIADSFDYCVTFLAKEAGSLPLSAEQKAAFHGLSLFRIARLLGISWFRLPVLLHKGRKHMAPAVQNVEPFQDMPKVIRKLHAQKHDLFILSTNTERNIHKFLRRHKLDAYFAEVHGGVGMFGKAPALRRMLRERHIETRKAVYISDELRDVQAAQSIGLRIIAVTWGFARAGDLKARKPTGMAHSPEDIVDILAKH
jgi:phosphoglycolate phosphatase